MFVSPQKAHLSLDIEYERDTADGDVVTTMQFLRSRPEVVLNTNDLTTIIDGALDWFILKSDEFTHEGSGWRIRNVRNLILRMAQFDPLGGSSFIPTPKWIASKKAVVNIKNFDDRCFLYSVLAFKHVHEVHAEQVFRYRKVLKDVNVDGLTFPMTIAQIPAFEAQNPDYSVNVILPSTKDKTFIPHYASKFRNRKYIANLLLLDDGDRRHYTVIRDLGRLVAAPYCLHCFTAANLLETHMSDCGTHGLQAVRYPTPGKNILKFTNIQNQFEV